MVTKKQTIFGDTLHLLVTLNGVILDLVLVPAHASDLSVGEELRSEHTDGVVLGDKGYSNQPVATELAQHNCVALLAIPRRNQKRHLSVEIVRLVHGRCQMIETVHDQRTEQFRIGSKHAHSVGGLCTHLYTNLTTHTLSVYLNRLFGNVDCLQIKWFAFPNGHNGLFINWNEHNGQIAFFAL